MKTSVTKIMMSFTLMGCLIFSASDAMAQGRSRSQGGSSSSRSQSAAVSRSNSSAAPQVSRSSSSSSSRSQATPQVNRSNSTTSRSQTSPQVNRSNPTTGAPTSVERRSDTRPSTVTTPSSGTPNRSNSSSHSSGSRNQGHGNGNGTIDRGGNSSGQSGSGHVAPLDNKTKHTTSRTGMTDDRTKASSPNSTTGTRVGMPGGDKPGGNGGGKPNGGVSGGNHGDKPGGGHGNEGHGKRPNDKGNGHKGNDRHGFDSRNHYDYTGHHYRNDFHRNYTHHNWSRPLPPPARPYRPAPIVWYRPVIPAGWAPYYGAPVIDRILGITFGTLFDVSLDYLYYNGYYIDGYADNIIYLREVPLLNLIWDDVMLCYDSSSRLVNAQFIIQSASYNTYRYDRVYRNLCRVYGNPVARTSEGISWYGGNSTGWVTLSMHNNLGHYYTTLSIGY